MNDFIMNKWYVRRARLFLYLVLLILAGIIIQVLFCPA